MVLRILKVLCLVRMSLFFKFIKCREVFQDLIPHMFVKENKPNRIVHFLQNLSLKYVVNYSPDVSESGDEKNTELGSESGQKPSSTELPEYLKQRLRARGILRDNLEAENQLVSDNASRPSLSLRLLIQ